MDVLCFCRLVVWTAVRHSASLARSIIFFVLAFTGATILLMPRLGMTVDASGLKTLLSDPTFYAILFGLIVAMRLICAPYWIWCDQRDAKKKADLEIARLSTNLAQLEILRVLFDLNGPTEFYLDFRISNPAAPTVVRAWQLLVATPKLSNPIVAMPRMVFTKVTFNGRNAAPTFEDLTTTPLEQGGVREGRLTFSFPTSAKDQIGERNADFELSAVDVRGRKIKASYSCLIIPTP